MSDDLTPTGDNRMRYRIVEAKLDALTKSVEKGFELLSERFDDHRSETRAIDLRVSSLEREAAKADGSSAALKSETERRIQSLEEGNKERDQKIDQLARRVWIMAGAAAAGGAAGMAGVSQLLGGG